MLTIATEYVRNHLIFYYMYTHTQIYIYTLKTFQVEVESYNF